jgi:sugar O-acyltransferase (sialic acid O-acetyltransferase NeuD family)
MADGLIVIGSGGHAKVVVEAALARTPGRKIVIVDDAPDAASRSILGIPIAGDRSRLSSLDRMPVIVAVGDNRSRQQLLGWAREHGYEIESVVHPDAIVAASVKLAAGAFVSAGAIVIAEAVVGAGAIVNTGASIDHDCAIGNAAHIAPGVHLCGNVRIGARTLVGVGSAIRPGISVTDDVVIGAGSVVVGDIEEPGTFAGNPARRLR